MYDIDTAVLRSFILLAETRSFSRTGALVGRSQSAISGQMRKLEDTFGRRLLDRTTRHVRLTDEGERLLGHARAMVDAADAMLTRFRRPDLEGIVQFGSPEDFASAYLPEILGLFAAAHQRVELHVTCQLTLPLVEEFLAGTQDLIIVKQDPLQPYAGSVPLWREHLVWVAAPSRARPFAELQSAPIPLCISPAPCVYRNRATVALDGAGAAWTGVFTSPSFAGLAAAVRAGLGYAVMPKALVPSGVVVLADFPRVAEAELALLCTARPSPAVSALAEFITQRIVQKRDQSDAAMRP